MVSSINNNPRASDAATTSSSDIRIDGADAPSSPALNIPNEGDSYQWFLPSIDGSRLTISPSDSANSNIRSDMNINSIVNHILSHVGS